MNEKVKDIIGMTLFGLFIIEILLGLYFLGIVGLFEKKGLDFIISIRNNWKSC